MDLSQFFPPRPEESRKGDFGRVLVVGGSERYAGAPAFNALAALRCGADLVTVLAPRRAADIVASYGPDLITHPCEGDFPELADVEELLPYADAVVIGGGIERSSKAHRALRAILGALRKPMVVDAEGLRALAGDKGLVRGKVALLTPHGGEYQAMTGREWPKDEKHREEACRVAAEELGATVIVKGRREVISDGKRLARDEAGSPYLTKGGYGDLIAGAAGAMLARGQARSRSEGGSRGPQDAACTPFDAARFAAFVVGRAGELASAELGESTLASDALAQIPRVLRESAARAR